MTYEQFREEWFSEHNDDSCDAMEDAWADHEDNPENGVDNE
jgi:hypothetical protein